MATLIQQSLSVVIQNKIVENLEALAIEQAAIDKNVNYFVYKDKLIPLDSESENFPAINLWIQSLDPINTNSTGKDYQQERVNFALDFYVVGKINEPLPPDEQGTERLKYLVQQAKHSILSLINIDFGLPAGTIAKRSWPNIQYFQPDLSEVEKILPTARMQFSVEYFYEPEDWKLKDLKILNVDTSLWSTLFNY